MRFFTILFIMVFITATFAKDKNLKIDHHRFFKAEKKLVKIQDFNIPKLEQAKVPLQLDNASLQKPIMVADKIETGHSVIFKIDSSRNGFGWLNMAIRSIDRYSGTDAVGVDVDFLVTGYRQYILATEATGIIGATTVNVANGLNNAAFYRYVELNQDLYEGTVGGRYPGAVALDRPFIHFNQYVSGDAKNSPAISHPYLITDYGSYGDNGGAWTASIKMDEGYHHYNFSENRLWNGPVEIVKDANDKYHYIGAYRNWTIEGESQPYEYVILNAESDDPTFGWTIDTNPTVIDTMNFFIYPAISMNSSGFGVCVGVGHQGPHPGDTFYLSELRLMVMTTHDFGKTWTGPREVSWAELGIPETITKDDSIYVPANPNDPNDTTMVIYEGPAYVAIPNNHSVDAIVTNDNKIYVAFDITWGPWATEESYYRDWHECGLHVAKSSDEGENFEDHHVAINNGFFVGDSSIEGLDDNLFFDSEADLSLDEQGNIYATWLDRPHKNIEPAEKSRYGDPNEGSILKADIFVSRSTDGGETWTEKMNVTQTQHVDEYELKAVRHAASKNNGTVYFAYCEVNPNQPVGQNDQDAYTYRTNRIWVGEATDFGPDAIDNPALNLTANGFALMQNYPNPFNPSTTINFHITKASKALLQIFDVNGRLVQTLFNAPVQTNHEYQVKFDGSNLASGIYFYRLRANDRIQTRKMVLMR